MVFAMTKLKQLREFKGFSLKEVGEPGFTFRMGAQAQVSSRLLQSFDPHKVSGRMFSEHPLMK